MARRIEWTVSKCEHSPEYRGRIDQLRDLAAKGLDGNPLTGYSLGELREHREAALQRAIDDPAKQPGVSRKRDPAGRSPLHHVDRYLSAVTNVARRWHGSELLADAVHELVGRDGYRATHPYQPRLSGPDRVRGLDAGCVQNRRIVGGGRDSDASDGAEPTGLLASVHGPVEASGGLG